MSDFSGGSGDLLGAPAVPPYAKWSKVTGFADGTYRVRLGGFFGPAWMANLCQGIAEHRLSIERAHALRARDLSWNTELNLVKLEGATDPETLPYVALADSMREHDAAALVLDRFELVGTPDHGGTLRLTIEADDVLGLLGSLLTQLAILTLFPIEMHIDTRHGRAYDCFWLGSIGRAPPSTQAHAALQKALTNALRAG